MVLLLSVVPAYADGIDPSTVEPARQQELTHLLRHDCGSCHGMLLKGGLGPALTPERMAPRSAQELQYTILQGRAGTAMPPWRGLLTEQEVAWLVQGLQQGRWQ